MPIELTNGVSYCGRGDQLIFLDIGNDRYVGANARCLSPERSAKDIELLAREGLVTGSGPLGASIRPVSMQIATCDVVVGTISMASPASMLATYWQMSADLRLKQRGLALSIWKLRRLKQRHPTEFAKLTPAHLHILTAFKSIAPLFSQDRNCLTRSLALACALSKRSLDLQLVLGVKFSPFAAHAWVQSGDFVLNDNVERIRHYFPIASF